LRRAGAEPESKDRGDGTPLLRAAAQGGDEAADFYYLPSHIYKYNNFDREGRGGADVYILCLEEFRSVGMLPPSGSSMFWILPPASIPDVLLAWHGSGPDFSVYISGSLRCLNPFPRENLFLTPTTSRLHCKMGTLSASVEYSFVS
jgi:hypothetical protein